MDARGGFGAAPEIRRSYPRNHFALEADQNCAKYNAWRRRGKQELGPAGKILPPAVDENRRNRIFKSEAILLDSPQHAAERCVHMRSMLIMVLAAGLAFLPCGAQVKAQDEPSGSPPIEQPLVSEGQFAVKLAAALGLTSSRDEAAAEDSLARANIAPRNGWISNYPMTPDIIEEVRRSAAMAASAGTLRMSEADAARAVGGVSSAMSLPVRAGGEYPQPGYNSPGYGPGPEYEGNPGAPPPGAPANGAPAQYVEPSEVDGYYSDNGPPVVTYYAPPWDYTYLYDWVPYPFWWGGFYFGGFFVLGDFNCWGGYHGHYYHGGHGYGGEGHRISNHVTGANGAVTRIDPVSRTTGGTRSAASSVGARSANMARFNSASARAGARGIVDRAARNPIAATRNLGGYGGTHAGTAGRAYSGGAYSGAHSATGTPSRSAYSGAHGSTGAQSGSAYSGARSSGGEQSSGSSSESSSSGGFGGGGGNGGSYGGHGGGGYGGGGYGGGWSGGGGGGGGGHGGGGFGGGGGGHR